MKGVSHEDPRKHSIVKRVDSGSALESWESGKRLSWNITVRRKQISRFYQTMLVNRMNAGKKVSSINPTMHGL